MENLENLDSQPSAEESEWAERISSNTQAYQVKENGVELSSRYYVGGSVVIEFENILDGGEMYKKLRDAGKPEGGIQ
jgi:hypothetical protein